MNTFRSYLIKCHCSKRYLIYRCIWMSWVILRYFRFLKHYKMAAMTSLLSIFKSVSNCLKFCIDRPIGVNTHFKLFSDRSKIKYHYGSFFFSIGVFICFKQVSVEKFEGIELNLIKNLQGAFPSRAPDSPWKLSLYITVVIVKPSSDN